MAWYYLCTMLHMQIIIIKISFENQPHSDIQTDAQLTPTVFIKVHLDCKISTNTTAVNSAVGLLLCGTDTINIR